MGMISFAEKVEIYRKSMLICTRLVKNKGCLANLFGRQSFYLTVRQ